MVKQVNHNLQMQQLYDDVVRHMEAEYQLMSRFVGLAQSIHDTLGHQLNPDLSPFDQQQKQLSQQAEQSQEKRLQIQSRIASLLDLPVDQATIRMFSEALPEPWSSQLSQRRQSLLTLHEQIGQLNRSNALLLQQSIDIYQSILMNLSGVPSKASTYSATGVLNQSDYGNLVRKGC